MPRPDIFVRPTIVKHLTKNIILKKPATGTWNALAAAMKLAEPGETIGFTGSHTAVSIGTGNQWSPNTVKWNSGPVNGLHIYGLDSSAKIVGEVSFGNNYGLPFNIHFSDYTHVGVLRSCFIVNQLTGPYLGLKFENIYFDTSAKAANGVPAIKWVMRFHGRSQFQVLNCRHDDRIIEHFVYADNVQGDSRISDCVSVEAGRTMIQIVNRIHSGPSGFGTIIIDNCESIRSGVTEGASAFTVAGHMGHVEIVGCKTIDARGGSVVSWWEGPNPSTGTLGAYLNADGMAIDRLVIRGCNFDAPSADRPVMLLSASSKTEIGACDFKSNKDAINLDHQQGKANKAFSFMNPSPSQWVWQTPRKVTKGHDKNNLQVLTDQEIDALYQE